MNFKDLFGIFSASKLLSTKKIRNKLMQEIFEKNLMLSLIVT